PCRLGRSRRSTLLGPGITVPEHGNVRVPAGDRAEGQCRARAVTGRDVARPVRTDERQLLLAGGAAFPERPLRTHPDPPPMRARVTPRTPRGRRSRVSSLGVVEDDAEAQALAGGHPADAVAHGHAVGAARAHHRPVAVREDDRLAALEDDDLGARLRARPLLDEQELAARVVRAAAGEHAGELEGKGERAVEVLMQAVVAAGRVAEEQRGGPRLPVSRTAREVRAQRGRKALRYYAHRLHPAVGDGCQVPVEMDAQRRDQRRQRRGEVLVLADAEAQARHVDAAPEAALVGPQADDGGALAGIEQHGCGRVAALVEAPRDRLPVETREPLLDGPPGDEPTLARRPDAVKPRLLASARAGR